jgi:site-specific recombinase XerD
VSLERIAELMGHENLETTRIYVTPSKQDLAVAVEQIAWSD